MNILIFILIYLLVGELVITNLTMMLKRVGVIRPFALFERLIWPRFIFSTYRALKTKRIMRKYVITFKALDNPSQVWETVFMTNENNVFGLPLDNNGEWLFAFEAQPRNTVRFSYGSASGVIPTYYTINEVRVDISVWLERVNELGSAGQLIASSVSVFQYYKQL
jgi:hypothetical protein